MGFDAEKRERDRIREVAQEYRDNGYRVVLEPGLDDRPAFLGTYIPDIVAVRDDDFVLIEVKTRGNLRDDEGLRSLAEKVQENEGWRLELVLTNPRQNPGKRSALASFNVLLQRSGQAKRLAEEPGGVEAAIILLWTVVEASIRWLATSEGMGVPQSVSRRVVKEAYSLGLVPRSDYEVLQKFQNERNDLVHGFTGRGVSRRSFASFERLAARLLSRAEEASDTTREGSRKAIR